jgi:hypothetical protein
MLRGVRPHPPPTPALPPPPRGPNKMHSSIRGTSWQVGLTAHWPDRRAHCHLLLVSAGVCVHLLGKPTPQGRRPQSVPPTLCSACATGHTHHPCQCSEHTPTPTHTDGSPQPPERAAPCRRHVTPLHHVTPHRAGERFHTTPCPLLLLLPLLPLHTLAKLAPLGRRTTTPATAAAAAAAPTAAIAALTQLVCRAVAAIGGAVGHKCITKHPPSECAAAVHTLSIARSSMLTRINSARRMLPPEGWQLQPPAHMRQAAGR